MTTTAYNGKASIIDRLRTMTAPGGRLDGVQVEYSRPSDTVLGPRCIYLGGVQFNQARDATAGARDTLKLETTTTVLVVRVVRDAEADAVRHAEQDLDAILDVVGEIIASEPYIAGAGSTTEVKAGVGDYYNDDQRATAVMAYSLETTCRIKP